MKVTNLEMAGRLFGRKVRYIKSGSRQGWEGMIVGCNTKRVEILYDNGVEQSYTTDALFDEKTELGKFDSYLLILDDDFGDQAKQQVNGGISTPEEEEAFERISSGMGLSYEEMAEVYKGVNYESQRPQEWSLAEIGRNIERFGKLLQDPGSTIYDLAGAAHNAGLNLRLGIQPSVE